MQAQRIGKPSGSRVEGGASGTVNIHAGGVGLFDQLGIVVGRHPDKDTGSAAVQSVRCLSRIFQRFPAYLQHQALLRVHADRFAWGNPEKLRVKFVDMFKKSAIPGNIQVLKIVDIPPVSRHFANSVAAVPQQLPECSRRVCPARKTAGHPHDSDRFLLLLFYRIEPCLHFFQCQHSISQQRFTIT